MPVAFERTTFVPLIIRVVAIYLMQYMPIPPKLYAPISLKGIYLPFKGVFQYTEISESKFLALLINVILLPHISVVFIKNLLSLLFWGRG